jgi:hypothetical protein
VPAALSTSMLIWSKKTLSENRWSLFLIPGWVGIKSGHYVWN